MSFTPAQAITSSQTGIHHNLARTVTKHLQSTSLKPIAEHNQQAFNKAYYWWQEKGKPPVILDSACGTGESSRYWAKTMPDHVVIGLDQSEKRLSHNNNKEVPSNCLLLRCECTDFWRLADKAGWIFEFHSLLYPNPYPKPQHLQRRWHGEAAFRNLLAISKSIELRSNWQLYVEEFFTALLIAKQQQAIQGQLVIEPYHPTEAITAFERKYMASGHALWRSRLIN